MPDEDDALKDPEVDTEEELDEDGMPKNKLGDMDTDEEEPEME